MRGNTGLFILVGLIFVIFLLSGIQVWLSKEEQAKWDAFALEHHCTVIEKYTARNSTATGLTLDGNVGFGILSSPAQTAYKCDDGVTYWR